MSLFRFWRYLTGHRRRVSFYDSQIMREATGSSGLAELRSYTDEALHTIVEKEPHTLRSELAHHELEIRAVRARQENTDTTRSLPH